MTYTGFLFAGKHLTADYGCYVSECNIAPPEKKQVTGTVPYMSGDYDFSALYGSPAFKDRALKYKIEIVGDDAADVDAKKQEIENWLMAGHRGQLIDDALPDWYFTAECISVDEADDTDDSSLLTLTFSAYPFKRSVGLRTASYAPSVAADVVCNNAGTVTVTPTITCAAAATVVYGGNTYTLGIGDHTSYNFALAPGNNTFNVTSAGAVTIAWRNEVL